MNENLHRDTIVLTEQIAHLVKAKNWYALTDSGRFLWEDSVAKMTEMISQEIAAIKPDQVREAIESSFDQESLSKVGDEYFIDCLLRIDPTMTLWSEGDLTWQELKARKTGLLNREGLQTQLIAKEKTSKLKDILLSLANPHRGEVCVVVIDDKINNLQAALDLQKELTGHNIHIEIFHLNLEQAEASPAACLKFILELQHGNIKIVSDMDGVLIDTNRVLSEIVPAKLTASLDIKNDQHIDIDELAKQFHYWNDEETRNYVRAIAHNPEPVLGYLSEKSLRGIGVNFHERFEMSLMEPLINKAYGEGAFRAALEKGQIELLKEYVRIHIPENQKLSIYLWSHRQAMLQELNFYKAIAHLKGVDLTHSSILFTIPHVFEGFRTLFEEKGEVVIEELFARVLSGNFGSNVDTNIFSQPTMQEIQQALNFWETTQVEQ